MSADPLCSGPEKGMPCIVTSHGLRKVSYERMDNTGTWCSVCYECVKISRRLGWRTRKCRRRQNEYWMVGHTGEVPLAATDPIPMWCVMGGPSAVFTGRKMRGFSVALAATLKRCTGGPSSVAVV